MVLTTCHQNTPCHSERSEESIVPHWANGRSDFLPGEGKAGAKYAPRRPGRYGSKAPQALESRRACYGQPFSGLHERAQKTVAVAHQWEIAKRLVTAPRRWAFSQSPAPRPAVAAEPGCARRRHAMRKHRCRSHHMVSRRADGNHATGVASLRLLPHHCYRK